MDSEEDENDNESNWYIFYIGLRELIFIVLVVFLVYSLLDNENFGLFIILYYVASLFYYDQVSRSQTTITNVTQATYYTTFPYALHFGAMSFEKPSEMLIIIIIVLILVCLVHVE